LSGNKFADDIRDFDGHEHRRRKHKESASVTSISERRKSEKAEK
jgi:hypothetical protein